MPSWKRDDDRELDAELRAARPEPRAEVTHAIADRVRPRRSILKRRIGRVNIALAGGVVALALTPVVAVSGNSVKSFFKPSNQVSAKSAEYPENDLVLVCTYPNIQPTEHYVSPFIAETWVNSGVAIYGPCP